MAYSSKEYKTQMSNKQTRVSPGVYRDATGNLLYIPNRAVTRSSRGKKSPKTGNKAQKETKVRGKTVSVRETASDAIAIYGTMRVGGVYTYLNTNRDSNAFLRTGEGDSQVVWIARQPGAGGNLISVKMVLGATAHTNVTVNDQEITVNLRFSGGSSRSTADSVIAAVKANAQANALVSVHRGDGKGTAFAPPVEVTYLINGGGTWLHHFITIAGHEIAGVDALYLDNRQVTFGASPDTRWATGFFSGAAFMSVQPGTDDQQAQPDLMVQVGTDQWSPNHRQQGCAGAYVITVYKSGIYPNGIPDVEFLVRGKKCFDFRTGQTIHTTNAALCLADFLCDPKIGAGIPRANLNSANWAEAANICDQAVELASGGSEPRYSINGTFTSGSSVENIIEEMLQAMGGDLVYQSGEWFCFPAVYKAPAWSITEADLLDEIKITTAVPRRDRFNAVRGTYINAADKYAEADYTAVTNNYYAELDGQVLYEDIPQPFVTSNAQAQRVAKIELERVRQGIEVDVTLGIGALGVSICDTIEFSYKRFGWESKIFEVRDIKISDTVENGFQITLKLRETASGVFDWSAEETTVDLAPDTNLPSPYDVSPPSDLVLSSGTAELYIRNDGTVFSRLKVTWTKPNDIYVTEGGAYQIQYKQSASSAWVSISDIDGDQSLAYILDVQDGQRYDVRVRSINSIRVPSEYITVTGHEVLGKSVPPTAPTSFLASLQSYGILFQWSKVPDLDVREYELRLGTAWASASFIARASTLSYTLALKTAGSYTALLKSLDTSGNYSETAASAQFSILGPSAPVVNYSLNEADIIIAWSEAKGSFAVDSYIVKYGSSFESAVTIAQVKSLNFQTKVSWSGSRRFFVQGLDVAGNLGAAGEVVALIQAPNRPAAFTADVIDNNILLRWDEPERTSLPIVRYELRLGETYATSVSLGSILGTFSARFEFKAGDYTYWLTTVDSAENQSIPASIIARMEQPPDFEFFGSHTFDFTSDSTNISDAYVLSASEILAPVSHATWSEHFAEHGWDSLAEQIEDNYPYLIHPTDTNASFEVIHNFGADINSTVLMAATYSVDDLSGTVAVEPTLSSSLDGINWTAYAAGSTRVYAQYLRFIKVAFAIQAADDRGLAVIKNLSVTLSVKEGTFAGNSTTDGTGKITINLNDYFSDVKAIMITPGYNAGFALVAVYDFIDQPNPTSFTVYTYRADNGVAVGNIPFSYNLRGYLA